MILNSEPDSRLKIPNEVWNAPHLVAQRAADTQVGDTTRDMMRDLKNPGDRSWVHVPVVQRFAALLQELDHRGPVVAQRELGPERIVDKMRAHGVLDIPPVEYIGVVSSVVLSTGDAAFLAVDPKQIISAFDSDAVAQLPDHYTLGCADLLCQGARYGASLAGMYISGAAAGGDSSQGDVGSTYDIGYVHRDSLYAFFDYLVEQESGELLDDLLYPYWRELSVETQRSLFYVEITRDRLIHSAKGHVNALTGKLREASGVQVVGAHVTLFPPRGLIQGSTIAADDLNENAVVAGVYAGTAPSALRAARVEAPNDALASKTWGEAVRADSESYVPANVQLQAMLKALNAGSGERD